MLNINFGDCLDESSLQVCLKRHHVYNRLCLKRCLFYILSFPKNELLVLSSCLLFLYYSQFLHSIGAE